jgi:hypothetical protein
MEMEWVFLKQMEQEDLRYSQKMIQETLSSSKKSKEEDLRLFNKLKQEDLKSSQIMTKYQETTEISRNDYAEVDSGIINVFRNDK